MLKHPWRLAALGIVSVVAVGWLAKWGSDKYNESLADWVAAVATLAAFLAAVIAAVFAAGAFRLESEREQRWTEAQTTAQASLVAAWYGTKKVTVSGDDPLSRVMRNVRMSPDHGVWVRNASEVPVQQARAAVLLRGGQVAAVVDVGVVPPGSDATFVYFSNEVEAKIKEYLRTRDDTGVWNDPQTELFFVDSAGISWCRYASGRLEIDREPWWLDHDEGFHTRGKSSDAFDTLDADGLD